MTDRNNYRLINLTGRPLSFTTHAVDSSYTVPPARRHSLPRASWSMHWEERIPVSLGGCGFIALGPITRPKVTNVPERREGVLYIVHREVVEACPERDDLVYPVCPMRDATGKNVGIYMGLSRAQPGSVTR